MTSRIRSYPGLLRHPEVKPLLVVLAIALVVQVIYFVRIQALYPPYGLTTEHYYSPLAQNLLHDGTYGFGDPPDIERSTKRPPFYSVVLAGIYGVFGENEAFALAFNNIVLFLTIIVVYLIGRTFSPKIGLLASLLFVIDPVGVINANKNQASVLYGFLFALFFLVTLRNFTPAVTLRRTAVSSLLLGLATLTRAVSLYLGLLVIASSFVVHRWLIRRMPVRRLAGLMAVFFVIQAAIIGGWMVRNYYVSGNPEFAGMTAVHLYSFFVPLVLSRETGVNHEEVKAQLASELEKDEEYLKLSRDGEKERYRIRKSVGIILDHPVSTFMVVLRQIPVVFLNYPQNAATLFLGEERRGSVTEYLAEYSRGKSSRLDVSGYVGLFRRYVDNGLGLVLMHGILYKLYYLIFMVSGAVGLLLLLRDRIQRPTAVFYLVVITYLVLVSSTWPTARLRAPILPIYAVVAAYSFVWYWSKLEPMLQRPVTVRLRAGFKRGLALFHL